MEVSEALRKVDEIFFEHKKTLDSMGPIAQISNLSGLITKCYLMYDFPEYWELVQQEKYVDSNIPPVLQTLDAIQDVVESEVFFMLSEEDDIEEISVHLKKAKTVNDLIYIAGLC